MRRHTRTLGGHDPDNDTDDAAVAFELAKKKSLCLCDK